MNRFRGFVPYRVSFFKSTKIGDVAYLDLTLYLPTSYTKENILIKNFICVDTDTKETFSYLSPIFINVKEYETHILTEL
jgi:hypothetical protein